MQDAGMPDLTATEQSTTTVPTQQTPPDESPDVPEVVAVAVEQKAVETPTVAEVTQSELAAPEPVEPEQTDSKPPPTGQSLVEAEELQPAAVTKKMPSPEKEAPMLKNVTEQPTPKVAVANVTLAPVREPSPTTDVTVDGPAVNATKTVHESTNAASTAVSTETEASTKLLKKESTPASSSTDVTPVSTPVEAKPEVVADKKMPDVVAAAEESRTKAPVISDTENKVKDEGKSYN